MASSSIRLICPSSTFGWYAPPMTSSIGCVNGGSRRISSCSPLAGATTKDAFYVRCGLGTTMTPTCAWKPWLSMSGPTTGFSCLSVIRKYSAVA